jgi:GTPase SAR1 family protein
MGICGSVENDVDDQIKRAEMEAALSFKFLLLGAGEAGKSTFVKQAKFVFNGDIPDSEKYLYARTIKKNAMDCMLNFVKNGRSLGVEEDGAAKQAGDKLLEMLTVDEDDDEKELNEEIGKVIDALWATPFLKETYHRRDAFWHLDASSYYFDNILRISGSGFTPSNQDSIMCRVLTTGVQVTEFSEGKLTYSVVDVGGQRSERRKWIHCFDNVHAIIFLASLIGYNQVLFEDGCTNRMHESLNLFKEIVKNPLFKDTPVFIMLNKRDLFMETIKEKDLSTCFPEYTGGTAYEPAVDHIKMKYKSVSYHCDFPVDFSHPPSPGTERNLTQQRGDHSANRQFFP